MEIINVLADCMSSGFWKPKGPNIDSKYFKDTLSTLDLMLMQYWHESWEFWIANGKASNGYIHEWNENGKKMCEEWNLKQNKFQFNYVPDYHNYRWETND